MPQFPPLNIDTMTQFANGDSGWADELQANWKKVAQRLRTDILDRNLTAPPSIPADGDRYIVAGAGGTATGAWAGQEHSIAVYNADTSPGSWDFYTPYEGELVYICDEEVLSVFKPSSDTGLRWSAGVAI